MATEFVHPQINQEVSAIGGHYVLTKEERLQFAGRDVVYLVGYTVVDSSCCAVGGFGYALVPGFVGRWRHKNDPAGRPVSEVEHIEDQATQSELRRIIEERELVTQVNFL